jgi:hypothetical protein
MLTRMLRLVAIGFLVATLPVSVSEAGDQGVTVTVVGESWDGDSSGFAYFGAFSKEEDEVTSARRGSRVSLDGHPETYAIAGPGPGFELTFTTSEPSFRLVVEGDRFPRLITQPFAVPEGGGEIDVGRLEVLRAEGPEHTWPLLMAAERFGYGSTYEMLADNKAAIRVLVWSSGADGAPLVANDAVLSVATAGTEVIPFTMDAQDTFFGFDSLPPDGAFLVIVPFADGDPIDKDVVLTVTDPVSEPDWEPPRPWTYAPKTVSIRNGFATDVNIEIEID